MRRGNASIGRTKIETRQKRKEKRESGRRRKNAGRTEAEMKVLI